MAITTPPRGVFCAALTPVHADLSPNHEAFAAHCLKLINDGLTGIALLGPTGDRLHGNRGVDPPCLRDGGQDGGDAPAILL